MTCPPWRRDGQVVPAAVGVGAEAPDEAVPVVWATEATAAAAPPAAVPGSVMVTYEDGYDAGYEVGFEDAIRMFSDQSNQPKEQDSMSRIEARDDTAGRL